MSARLTFIGTLVLASFAGVFLTDSLVADEVRPTTTEVFDPEALIAGASVPAHPARAYPRGESIPIIDVARLFADLQKDANQAQTHILAVGIDRYPHLSPLTGCANDARMIASHFRRQGAKVVDVLVDEKASRANVCRALDSLNERSKDGRTKFREGDLVVIYLSGHGARSGGDWYFMPHDFGSDRQRSTEYSLNASAVSSWNILSNASSLLATGCRVMLIIDSCHAGEIRHTNAWDCYIRMWEDHAETSVGMTLLASSVGSQASIAGTENSRFTRSLLEGFSGKADRNQDRKVTLREIDDYLSWRIREVELRQFKLPGFSWKEQNHIRFSTDAIPESLVLARDVAERPLRQGEDLNLKPGTPWASDVAFNPRDLLGTWLYSKEAPGPGGKVTVEKLVLDLEESGKYSVAFQFEDPFGQRRTLSDSGRFRSKTGLCLEYGNGTDMIRVESLSKTDLRLTFFPEPEHRPTTFSFKRIVAVGDGRK